MTRPLPSPSGSAAGDVLLALADRCEREEPSRELDHAIMWSLRPGMADEEPPAAYTTSLDAAVTLVPEGCAWSCSSYTSAFIHFPRETELAVGGGKTPALRLCAAALRARASLPNPPHGGGA